MFFFFLKLKKIIRLRKELLRQDGTEVCTCCATSATLHVIWRFRMLFYIFIKMFCSVVLHIFVVVLNSFDCFFTAFRQC